MCALVCALPARALASATEQSTLMDDAELLYASPQHVASRLQQIKALGVDRIKFSIVWDVVAPNPSSTHRPSFDATDPAAYPAGVWDRYDTVVRLAKELGFRVYLQLTPPSPSWAVSRQHPTQGYSWSQRPNAAQYGQFVQAVGRRFSGTYMAPVPSDEPTPAQLGLPPGSGGPSSGASGPIPRVDFWGIWNEPNEGAWLNPQTRTIGRRTSVPVAPALYRGLVDAGYGALARTGHARDTILIGETASGGITRPLPFVSALYCVSSSYRPLTGTAAAELSCPRSGDRATFARQHPGLFRATGFAHHPYSFDMPPSTPEADPNEITLANAGKLGHALDRILALYGKPRAGGVPLYMTEWGYKSNPPNPFVRTSLSEQETWLNQGEYLSWKNSRVRTLAQFLLLDSGPQTADPVGSRGYWGTYQTGLLYADGTTRKPAYAAYRLPIWLPVARHGRRVTVWGQLRPADHTKIQSGAIQYRRHASQAWRTIRTVQTASPEGFLVAHVALPVAGQVRLTWHVPGTEDVYYSRTVRVG